MVFCRGEGPCLVGMAAGFREQQEWSCTVRLTGWELTGTPAQAVPSSTRAQSAVSELDGQRWGKATRSHQQPQARQGDESRFGVHLGFQSGATEGPETIQERQ